MHAAAVWLPQGGLRAEVMYTPALTHWQDPQAAPQTHMKGQHVAHGSAPVQPKGRLLMRCDKGG